jgi:putative flippase GtrA
MAPADCKRLPIFLLTSGFSAVVNLGSRWVFSHYMRFEIAVVVAFFFGVTMSYVLARKFVFKSSDGSIQSEFHRFLGVNLVALILVWITSILLADHLFPAIGFGWHAEDIAHFIAVAMPAVGSYLAHRAYTFKSSPE